MQTEAQKRAQKKYRSRPEIKKAITQKNLAKLRIQRQKAVDLLGGVCYICKRNSMKFLHFHHLTYPNGNPYKTHRSKFTAYRATIREVLEKPKNFRLLCKPCHDAVTVATSVPEAYERLLEIIDLTLEKRLAK
jgi:5-methylcytosine-specific restriction endonuclease McrA